jgi:hypothetical protein
MRASVVPLAALFAAGWFVSLATGQGAVRVTNTVVVGTVTAIRTGSGSGYDLGPSMPKLNVVIVGKVLEIEPDTVEVAPFRGAPKERMVKYKVATVKIEDAIHGAGGITRIRVGFLPDGPLTFGPTAGTRTYEGATDSGQPRGVVTLATGTECLFNLAKHPNADFYVMIGGPRPKKDAGFAKEVDKLKKYAKTINDPVAALKAKDLDERFEAAQMILQRYLIPQGSTLKEPIPEDENRALVALLTDLPWLPADGRRIRPDGRLAPHRAALWYSLNPTELGFQRPAMPKRQPGDPPVDSDKLMDEATTKFLKENGEKIKLKRFVQK